MVFPTSVIRTLAPSEQWYAQNQTFGATTVQLTGTVDPDAMSVAFDTLLRVHPTLAGHLTPDAEGRFQIVVDDLEHPGLWLTELGGGPPTVDLDAGVSLINLMVRTSAVKSEVTLFVHHSIADSTHAAALVYELFSRYTDVVSTGQPGPVKTEPAPEPLEKLLAQRGIHKIARSGLERFIPATRAYDPAAGGRPTGNRQPPGNPTRPVAAPTARGRLSKQETAAVVDYGLSQRLFLNPLVSAAILMAEWRLRRTPDVSIPYVYEVDLRMLLSPPVPVTGATNPLGMATYLARIAPDTKLVELGRDIAGNLARDLAEGVVQQSLLHFASRHDEGLQGLPDVVSANNFGRTPTLHTPPGLRAEGWQSDVYQASSVVDMYSVGIVDERLAVEHHTYAPEPQRSVDLVLSILREAGREGHR